MFIDGINQGPGHIGTVALGDDPNALIDGALKLHHAVIGAGFVVEGNDLQFFSAQNASPGVYEFGHILKMF